MANWPVHNNPREDRAAKAPYNFVPLPEKVVTVDAIPPQDRYDHYTGYIECTLVTKSPLYTRAGMNPEAFGAWSGTRFEELPEEQKNERAQFFYLAIGQDVACGVGWPRDTNRADTVVHLNGVKINAILESMFIQELKLGHAGDKYIRADTGVDIPDVFRRQRQ